MSITSKIFDKFHKGESVFKEMTPKNLPGINARRRAETQPDIWIVPQLDKPSVQFVTASSRHNEPNSCYNCYKFNETAQTCGIIGPHTRVVKFTYGEPDQAIEYWPVCGAQDYGEPNKGPATYSASNDPDLLGLCWINAPKVGLKYGGTNCGGVNGGDDCDFYMPQGDNPDKRAYPEAFCQVLQEKVAAGDCCAAWMDDDLLSWQLAKNILDSGQAENVPPQPHTGNRGLKSLRRK